MRDWRVGQLNKMANVAIYRDNLLTARDVLDFGAEHVVLATGCRWRRDGFGRSHGQAIPGLDRDNVFTPDDLLRGTAPDGPVLLFDDDSFYMGSVLAEVLRGWPRGDLRFTPQLGRVLDQQRAGIPADCPATNCSSAWRRARPNGRTPACSRSAPSAIAGLGV